MQNELYSHVLECGGFTTSTKGRATLYYCLLSKAPSFQLSYVERYSAELLYYSTYLPHQPHSASLHYLVFSSHINGESSIGKPRARALS